MAWIRALPICILAFCVLSAPTALADPQTARPEDPGLQSLAVNDLASSMGISSKAAAERIAKADRTTGAIASFERVAGTAFAGTWFGSSDGNLKIAVSDDRPKAALDELIRERGLQADADIVTVRYSISDLIAGQEHLNQALYFLAPLGLFATAIDTSRNQVVLRVASNLTAQQEARVQSAVAGVPADVDVTHVSVAAKPDLLYACSWYGCDPPLRGGEYFAAYSSLTNPNAGAGQCTSGFVTWSRSDAKPYMLTAGHCLQTTPPTVTTKKFFAPDPVPPSPNYASNVTHVIGAPHHAYVGPYGDAGIVDLDPALAPIGSVGSVRVFASSDTTANDMYSIDAEGSVGQDAPVCATGRGSAAEPHRVSTCGHVVLVNAYIPYSSGGGTVWIGGLTVFRNCVIAEGASGGPVYKVHSGYGTIVGGASYVAGGCSVAYITIATAEALMNVDL